MIKGHYKKILFLSILISCKSSIIYYNCRTILEYENKESKGVFFKIGHEFEYEYEWLNLYKETGREELFNYNFNYKNIVDLVEDSICMNIDLKKYAYYSINKYYRQIEIIDVSKSKVKIGVNFIIKSKLTNDNEYLKMPISSSEIRDNFNWEFILVNTTKIVKKLDN